MSMITKQLEDLRELANSFYIVGNTRAELLLKDAADTIEQLAAKIRQDNRTEEAKDRQENTIDKILTLIDAETWGYIDYLKKQERFSGDLGDHINCLSENIRERLREELPGILSDEYEKAFMEGFESHPTHNTYQKAFEDIRTEIDKTLHEPDYQHEGEDWQNGLIMAENIVEKYDLSKVGKENK